LPASSILHKLGGNIVKLRLSPQKIWFQVSSTQLTTLAAMIIC